MTKRLNISFDSDLLEAISSDFDLRAPNKEALRKLVFTLDGDYDPQVQQVLSLATGVGKTYLMAAFVEYLRRQGVGNVIIVTPGKTVQAKTVQNFSPGSLRFIKGSPVPPEVVTPQDYSAWIARTNGAALLSFGREVPMLAFIFNIQQLIAPKETEGNTHGATQDSIRRKPRRFDEHAGVLFDYLKGLDDLVVIADESHLYGTSAVAFNAALKELDPAATIGLTASVNKETDHVIYEYPLYRAIQDKFVKAPVLAFRKGGYGADTASEEQQLRDALRLRETKQAYYNSYAENASHALVNAVLFVVCSDVDHATQVTALLRTPEFFGKDSAVLQVDSKHEDDATQKLLERLDQPDSPVLAVVSVNKLKEGWDVKNIAVIVTLRAMASEVLTQQTMGRGLRLPFGKYTGIGQIDQLDIIAHQSFTELLAAENVLQQFGLEEAVKEIDKKQVEEAIHTAAEQPSTPPGFLPTPLAPSSPAPSIDLGLDSSNFSQELETDAGATVGDQDLPSVSVRTIDGELPTQGAAPTLELVIAKRNPAFSDVEYAFPTSVIEIQQPSIVLSGIDDLGLEKAARKVTSTGDVLLRKEIIAALGKKLRTEDRESAHVDSVHVDDADAQDTLVRLVMNMNLVPKTSETARFVESFLVPKFMSMVTFKGWTVKSLGSARDQLQQLIQDYIHEVLRSSREIPKVHPKIIQIDDYCLPLGEKIHDQVEDRADFVVRRTYGGWFKSLMEAESFDSYSGEYVLAKLLNTSPSIVWWHRLHPQAGAYIYYNAKDRYYPDFVALDTDGVYWIIEGKDERGRDDAKVQAKRKAAESLVRHLAAEEAFAGQHWGYLIAYEQDTARADTWDDLKSFAQPVSNAV